MGSSAGNKLKSGIIKILTANILNMIFSLGTNFLLPKYVSIDSYAQIKTYQLYVSYIALLQLGYSDGMYLKFGGKDIKSIPLKVMQEDISTLRVFQLGITIASVIVACLFREPILLLAAVAIFPQNIISYYKNLFQAVGTFGKYSRIMNYTTGATFLINFILLFIVKTDSCYFYIVGYLMLSVVLAGLLECTCKKDLDVQFGVKGFSIANLIENIKSGILLLFANFSSILLTSMDRVFIKVFMDSIAFAQYSFAVSIESFLNVAVSPVTVTLYNYFCINKKIEDVIKIRDQIVGFSSILIACAFPVKFIIEIYIPHYTDSVNVVFLLFAAQLFLIIVRSVYSNLYKAKKLQNLYFKRMCIVIIAAFVLNYSCYLLLKQKEAFAIGTLLSAILWFVLSWIDFKEILFSLRSVLYIVIEVIAFLYTGCGMSSIIGCILYVIVTIAALAILMPNVLKSYFGIGMGLAQKVTQRH